MNILDWEFPGDEERGGSPNDKPNFSQFVKELREAVDEEDSEQLDKLIISAAVSAGKSRINQGYEIKKLCKEIDFINLMA